MLQKMNRLYNLLSLTFLIIISTCKLQAFDQNYDNPTNNATVDPYKVLHIIPNANGTITRLKYFPTVQPNTSIEFAYSKDTPLNPRKNTWVRTYLPKDYLDYTQHTRLPVIIYAHGGGFVILSAATPNADNFCARMASRLKALVVSVEYRLSPEHRLPDAYDDVMEALYLLRDGNDDWVKMYGNVSKCVIMGESAGGNIAYTLGLRASTLGDALNPLIIRGLGLIQPFFGGVSRSESELRLDKNGSLPLCVTDLFWNLSLPIGTNRDEAYCNPFTSDSCSRVQMIKRLGWRVAVVGYNGDPLFDRQVELTKWLKKQGVHIRGNFSTDHYHGVVVNDYAIGESFFEFVISVFSPLFTHRLKG